MTTPRSKPELVFTANYGSWPFNEALNPGDQDYGYEQKIPAQLKRELRAWALYFQKHFDEVTGQFPTQEHRAKFDRRYIELANELRDVGLNPRLDIWW